MVQNRFDFGVNFVSAVNFVEMDNSSLTHLQSLAAAGDFADLFKAKLENRVDGTGVVFNRSFLNDVDAGVLNVTAKDQVVFWRFVDGF